MQREALGTQFGDTYEWSNRRAVIVKEHGRRNCGTHWNPLPAGCTVFHRPEASRMNLNSEATE